MIEKLKRAVSGALTSEDSEIFERVPLAVYAMLFRADRADAERMFMLVDSSQGLTLAPPKETPSHRDNRL